MPPGRRVSARVSSCVSTHFPDAAMTLTCSGESRVTYQVASLNAWFTQVLHG
jgi:hypothetical protein